LQIHQGSALVPTFKTKLSGELFFGRFLSSLRVILRG
jgi:hypothetical protein